VPDLNGFVQGIATLLKPDGVAVIEFPYLRDMIEKCEFDTIYHEHLCYFSLTAVTALFARHGLQLVDIERLPVHGGSLRIFAARASASSAAALQLLADEKAVGMATFPYYAGFASRVDELRKNLLDLLTKLKMGGASIAAYGASAKGSTLLNCFGIGKETLDFVVDRSTEKQGRHTPGTHLPILAPQCLASDPPDYLLLLSWNFLDEVLAQQSAYRKAGGRFIVPVPEVRII
jgi:hypothetical protein